MGLPTSADSDTSLISIDPAVARQISRSNSCHPQPSAKPRQPSPAEPTEQQLLHISDHAFGSEYPTGKPLPKSVERTRKSSLRRVKNSNEILRQRSNRAQHEPKTSDGTSAMQGGRHFTVGNVGTGGKLYLRPAAKQQQRLLPTAFVFPSPTPPSSASHDVPEQDSSNQRLRQSIWSDSQSSDKAMKAKPARTATVRSKLSDGPPRPSAHTRPFSFSTVDDKHKTSAELEDGTLRIVIDRSATSRPKTTEDLVLPTLNIPIPHYRMGKPHFSVQGTPILRSSAYTRTSEGMSESTKPVSPPKQEFLSPHQARANIRSLPKSHTSDTFTSPDGAVSDISRDSTRLADSAAADYSYKEPINPEVFDKLASVKDDECVVRYSQRTGAITAATPARIVAQISSEAFMDYDLVSDFFLTFRAYLSTEDLLSLLLARLHWAINRLEDDGRIIRIRTFAALRHWILNYFVDDFVVNRKLRVQFCNQINEMYREVRQRTGGGVSDMKILLDLKRCWNGRCSLYWDSTDFVVDTQQEADIVPGGIFGSRDPSLTQLDPIVDQESKHITDTFQNKASASKTCYGSAVAARAPRIHDQPSIPIPGAPVSPTSEQSLQPASCSLPARAFKRSPPPEGNARGPYPVSVQLRKQNASPNPLMSMKDSQRRLSNAHKRSCSTSDSIRDRGSTNSLSRPVFLVSPHAGSLIRGNVYPPAAPFVDVIAPESPPSRSRLTVPAMGMPATFDGSSKPGSPVNPAMKNLMGSIRRALSSKQTGTHSASSIEEISRSPPSLRGKTSGLPLNMTRSSDNLRDKKSTPVVRHHLRIDLLCAAASQSYQQAQAKASQDSFINHGLGLSISDIHEGSASQNSLGSRDFSIEAGDVRYILGEDDVDFGMVVTDNAGGETTAALDRGMKVDVSAADFDYTTAGMMSMPLLPTGRSIERKDSSLDIRRRSSSVDTALARKSKEQQHSRAVDLAKSPHGAGGQSRNPKIQHHRQKQSAADSTSARSQQSHTGQSVVKHAPAPSVDASVTSISTKGSRPGLKPQAAGQTLRRRPGGNLRNIENVHDLTEGVRRQSTGSLTTRSESVGSLLVMGGSRAAGSKQKRPAPQTIQHPVSLMRTHSSQHLRPSFEAAISGFSTIPDDDDCGLEATLLKLEGRYDRASRQVTNTTNIEDDEEETPLPELLPLIDHQHKGHDRPSQSKPVQVPISSRPSHPRLRQPSSFSRTRKPGPTSISTRSGRSKGSAARSEESYSSIPLLERGLMDDSMKEKQPLPRSNLTTSIPRPVLEDLGNVKTEQNVASPHPSIELVEKTESMGRIPQGGTFPDPQSDPGAAPEDGSFLLDEDDDLTDLSSEMSMDVIEHSEAQNHVVFSPSATVGMTNLDHELLTHPLAHPPSPAVSFHQVITSVPAMNPMMYQQKPLTPQPSPTQGVMPEGSQVSLSQILPRRKSAAVASATVTTSAGHIPFVLACESEILAQQLTLVEKAALSEIEWSDLVDMKWDNKSPNILNWVEYLAGKDHKGIDIVITRFNIVVKWVVSEIVMTQNINERAQAITKYIHIAVHSKLLHNYATMLQITIALTSLDCSRLKATWELVPDLERARLKEMETLIQPIRNFHDLRIEMETANLQDGCIPFVGIYIHDLTYNAQKPSRIANTGNGEPLVNFERYRTAATIVKSLLRLIDASSKYDFQPIPGIIERCLWMAALSDEKITALSKSIEY